MDGTDPLLLQCRARIGLQIQGKYRLDALIGVGGMAAVYMATHRNGNVAAIKLLHPEVARVAEVKERFLREAYIANKVGHEGTVKVLDDDVDEEGAPFLVMELLQGKPLDAVAEQAGGRLPIDTTLDMMDQTLAVLEAAHRNQIIHRDLKPENLFLTDRGGLKVLDFGIARLREESARKTQTGLVMGTPSFMAPEQAMGRTSEVDARTDLYAVGATAFTLLTGAPVHEADSAGEMLVAAATRPARSLARLLPSAPLALISLVDKALSYERTQRYASASAFRAEVQRLRAQWLSATPAPRSAAPPARPSAEHPTDYAPPRTPTAPPHDPQPRVELDHEVHEVDTYDPSTASPAEIAALSDVFVHFERALVATKQYGLDHPEPKRRFDETFKRLASALLSSSHSLLAWTLTPYGFNSGQAPIWEPEAPWNRIPYQLFSDGVRTMGFELGLTEEEFSRWVQLVTLDPATDLPIEDDLVTRLWDSNFTHAFHQAIDSFAEGGQDQRAGFEVRRRAVLDRAKMQDEAAVADAWRSERKAPSPRGLSAARSTQVVRFLAGEEANLEKSTLARVQNLDLVDPTDVDLHDARRALSLEPGTQSLLAARLAPDVGATSERFVQVAAHAFAAAAKAGSSALVSAPLRRALQGLSETSGEQALAMVVDLHDALPPPSAASRATPSLRSQFLMEVLSPDILAQTLTSIVRSSPAVEDPPDDRSSALSTLLPELGASHLGVLVDVLPTTTPGPLRALLLDHVLLQAQEHALLLTRMFAHADLQLSLVLLRTLAKLTGPHGPQAAFEARKSPHALVRIEALSLMEGAGGVGVKQELRKLLDDPGQEVRLAALKAMQEHSIAAAGPFLVVRIKEPDFHRLSLTERRQALSTLCTLKAQRCEEVCIALLGEVSWLRSKDLETTRELAAALLGDIARTDAALFALERVAQTRDPRQSRGVREAAREALERLNERAEAVEKSLQQKRQPAAKLSTYPAHDRRRGEA